MVGLMQKECELEKNQQHNKKHRIMQFPLECFSHQMCCCGIYIGSSLSPHTHHPAEPGHPGNRRLDYTLMCLYTQCHHGDLRTNGDTASHKATPPVLPHSLSSDKERRRMMKQSWHSNHFTQHLGLKRPIQLPSISLSV